MKVFGNQNSFVTNSLQNTLFYVVQNKVIQVWNDMRVIDDRIIIFCVNYRFNEFFLMKWYSK